MAQSGLPKRSEHIHAPCREGKRAAWIHAATALLKDASCHVLSPTASIAVFIGQGSLAHCRSARDQKVDQLQLFLE